MGYNHFKEIKDQVYEYFFKVWAQKYWFSPWPLVLNTHVNLCPDCPVQSHPCHNFLDHLLLVRAFSQKAPDSISSCFLLPKLFFLNSNWIPASPAYFSTTCQHPRKRATTSNHEVLSAPTQTLHSCHHPTSALYSGHTDPLPSAAEMHCCCFFPQ